MTYDVFISYSSKDQKVAEGICGFLEANGVRCFVAYRDIPRGKVWAREVVNGLENSRMMVVLFSRDFNLSEQVDREIELAAEDHKPILTFRIADTQFTGAKKYYLKNINWIDAFPDPTSMFGPLLDNVHALLGNKTAVKAADTAPVATPATAPKEAVVEKMHKPEVAALAVETVKPVESVKSPYPRPDWTDEDINIFNTLFKPFGFDMLDFDIERFAAFMKSRSDVSNPFWDDLYEIGEFFNISGFVELRGTYKRPVNFLKFVKKYTEVFCQIIFDHHKYNYEAAAKLFKDWFENKMGLKCILENDSYFDSILYVFKLGNLYISIDHYTKSSTPSVQIMVFPQNYYKRVWMSELTKSI